MKVLISAYACEPGRGSEPGAGWAWARAAAQDNEVWVLTHSTNRQTLEPLLAADHALAARLHPVYLRNPWWARPLRRRGPTRIIYYFLWQITTCRRTARQLHASLGFDVAHHITYASDWMPVGVSRIDGLPFVWGPVGGASTLGGPRLWALLGVRTIIDELLRAALLTACLNLIGRPVARRAALVLGQNVDVGRAFAPVPVTVEPNVALDANEEAIPRPERTEHAPLAVFAGRLLGWKGLRIALLALRQPAAAEWRLHVYGDGPQRPYLQRLISRWALDDRVQLFGTRPRAEVKSALSGADALLFPSVHDAAGWSIAEAAAVGCPVVCLDVGGPATIVGPSDGIRVPIDGDVIVGLARGLEQSRGLHPQSHRWSAERLPTAIAEYYCRAIRESIHVGRARP